MKHIKTSVAENIDIKQTSPPAMTKGAHLSGKTGLTIFPDMVGPLHPGRPANGRHSVTKAVYSVVFSTIFMNSFLVSQPLACGFKFNGMLDCITTLLFPYFCSQKTNSWKSYFAFNVIGVVWAADCELSEYDIIMEGDENIPPLRL